MVGMFEVDVGVMELYKIRLKLFVINVLGTCMLVLVSWILSLSKLNVIYCRCGLYTYIYL